ncbi:hypothetical protein [Nostoc sp.]|uniref:hypothetical protein n=1 Tax=Nostoc sp. TaxID=1180 RepID=UPI002FFD5574
MQSTDVRETIASINRNSGISNNMMAYRLALMMEKVPHSVQSPIDLDSQSRQILEDKLRNILTTSTQNIEDYRLQLKNKYLAEYSQKFGITQSETPVTEQPNNFSRVENLITQRKHIFLQQMIAQESKANLTPPTSPNQGDEFSKKSLIPAVVQTIIAKGQDTKNEGRVYEGVLYRLQLLIKEKAWDIFMSLVSTTRKLEISFFDYMRDRISQIGNIPSLGTIIRGKSVLNPFGWSWMPE